MGLFSGLTKLVGGVAGSLIQGSANKKAIKKAADVQAQALADAIGLQKQQYAETSDNLNPFIDAGTQALGQQGDLVGLNGAPAQQTSIDDLKASPLYQSLFGNGVETINAQAAATGGLRGGNQISSLANFGRDSLASVIQQQLANLGGLSAQGQNAAGALGGFGANATNQIAGLTTDTGNVKAGSILGRQAVDNNTYSSIQGLLGSLVGGAGGVPSAAGGGGGLGSILSSILGGGGLKF